MEKVESLLDLYRKEKITDYVIERELSSFLGNDVSVLFSKDCKNNIPTSFILFAVPEKLVEGLHLTLIVDKMSLLNNYSDTEIGMLFDKFKSEKYTIYKKYMTFLNENIDKDISFNYALGFLLNLYASYKNKLIFDNSSFLPSDDELLKYCDKFSMEEATSGDLESLLIQEFICPEIVDFAKKYVRQAKGELRIKTVENELDKYSINFGQQEIRKYANNCLDGWNRNIPFDYVPDTNQ